MMIILAEIHPGEWALQATGWSPSDSGSYREECALAGWRTAGTDGRAVGSLDSQHGTGSAAVMPKKKAQAWDTVGTRSWGGAWRRRQLSLLVHNQGAPRTLPRSLIVAMPPQGIIDACWESVHLQSINPWQRKQEYIMEKRQSHP